MIKNLSIYFPFELQKLTGGNVWDGFLNSCL